MRSKLKSLFSKNKILKMEEIKSICGTSSRMTAFRRLKALSYCSSYSHRGKYYTLNDIPEYNQYGVWAFKSVYFSRYGTLLNTVTALIKRAESGYTTMELETILHVRVQNAVKILVDKKQLIRQKIGHEYIYVYPGNSVPQLAARKRDIRITSINCLNASEDNSVHLTTFLSVLTEKQRRLYLGFESLKIGHGGDKVVASLTGMNVKTVARGRQELISKAITVERIREAGAGRPPLKKKP